MGDLKYDGLMSMEGVIMPQDVMVADDGSIFVFDKINIDEGRLYRFDRHCLNKRLVLEVDDGECVFGRDGCIYFIYREDNTTVEVFSTDGQKLRQVTIPGIIYFMDVDTSGNLYCLFPDEYNMHISIYDRWGKYLRSLHSNGMPIISALYCEDGNIYAGGISKNISLRIEKLNWMGYLSDFFDIGHCAGRSIVSKIVVRGSTIVAVLSGGDRDSVIMMDESEGEKRITEIPINGISSVSDICIKGDTLFVISDDLKVLEHHLKDGDHGVNYTSINECKKRDCSVPGYRCIQYMIWLKNLPRDFLNMFIRFAVPCAAASLFLYMAVFFRDWKADFSILQIAAMLVRISLPLSIAMVCIKKAKGCMGARLRVDNMLDIYNTIGNMGREIVFSSVFMGIISSMIALVFGYNHMPNLLIAILSVLPGAGMAGLTFGFGWTSLNKLKNKMDNVVFELLCFDTDDNEVFRMIRRRVQQLRKAGVEKYSIRFRIKDGIENKAIDLIKRWSILRRKITGDEGKLYNGKSNIEFELDLKNRDIRYSRLSVIEDFICYIKNTINLSSLDIETVDNKSSEQDDFIEIYKT